MLVVDKTLTSLVDTEAQAIVGVIAASQSNNSERMDHDLNPLDTATIPCIRMAGARPIFYLVPVTTELSNAVASSLYPTTQTRVLWCPTVTWRVRMENTEYRH